MKNTRKVFSDYFLKEKETVVNKDGLKITSFGTTSLLFDDGENKILFDGMISRPNLVRVLTRNINSKRRLVEKFVNKFELNNLKGIFVSHSHYDHVLDVPNFAKLTGATVYGSVSTLNVCRGNGVNESNLIKFNTDVTYKIGEFEIKVFKSLHSKANKFNNDLGIEISSPIKMPCKMKKFTEGGSYDFLVRHKNKSYLIRPSCNYIKDELNDIHADVMFMGVGYLDKLSKSERENMFKETVEKVGAKTIIPIHWDDFFVPLKQANIFLSSTYATIEKSLNITIRYSKKAGINLFIIPALYSVII